MPQFRYPSVIQDICDLPWGDLTRDDMITVAWAYYPFSIQFRENLEVAVAQYPGDAKLAQLKREECETDNLSPWLGVAAPGERMNHDEYMRRTLELEPIEAAEAQRLRVLGGAYLADMRAVAPEARAASIASYEDGGLESVFRAILTFDGWDGALLKSFEHFLVAHIQFDSDPDQGHGALSRHIVVDDAILPCWLGFYRLLLRAVPALAKAPVREVVS